MEYWDRPVGRLGRRRVLALGGSAAFAAALAGCGGGDDKGSSSGTTSGTTAAGGSGGATTTEVKRGGKYRQGSTITVDDIYDPHVSVNLAAVLWSFMGDQMVRYTPDLSKILPELAQTWEIPGDGTEIVFHTRPDAKWHNKPPTNGRNFTAEDVAFNLERITGRLNPDKVAQFSRRSTLPNLDKAVAVDATTTKVTLTAPSASFINGLCDFRNTLIPKDYVMGGGDFIKPTQLVGTGAWVADSWDISSKSVMKPFTEYWDKGKPYLDQIEVTTFADRLSYQTAFSKGDVDDFNSPNKAERDSLKVLVKNYREEKWVQGLVRTFRLNSVRPAAFADQRVRKAIFLALDYKAMMDDSAGPGYWTWSGPLSVFPEAIPADDIAKMPGYNPATKAADRKTANDLLTAAGFPGGRGLAFKIMPSSAQETDSVHAIDDLKSTFPNIQVELDIASDSVAFNRRMVAGEFDAIAFNLGTASDPIIELEGQYGSKGSRNYQKFKDDQVDALLAKAQSQLDANARKQTMLDLQQRLIDAATYIKFANANAVIWYAPHVKGAEKYGLAYGTSTYDYRYVMKNVWVDK
jgi:peptide/nickel transport system substrate-binding protein